MGSSSGDMCVQLLWSARPQRPSGRGTRVSLPRDESPSLDMDIELNAEGQWVLTAQWLSEPLVGDDWFELYWQAVRLRRLK